MHYDARMRDRSAVLLYFTSVRRGNSRDNLRERAAII